MNRMLQICGQLMLSVKLKTTIEKYYFHHLVISRNLNYLLFVILFVHTLLYTTTKKHEKSKQNKSKPFTHKRTHVTYNLDCCSITNAL